jgi:hypothetical protein
VIVGTQSDEVCLRLIHEHTVIVGTESDEVCLRLIHEHMVVVRSWVKLSAVSS